MNREQKVQNMHVSQHSSNEMLSAALSEVAKFMGKEVWVTKTAHHPDGFPYVQSDGHAGWQPVQYHSSWDWLMPAVNKFINENIRPVESRELNEYRSYVNSLYNLITDFNIIDVFNCLCEALKWLKSVGSR